MNKRDFLKTSAALAAAPALLPSIGSATSAMATRTIERTASIPTPTYIYDSARRVMTFYRADRHTRAMHGYLANA
jgi:hypothetical protein